MFRLAVYSRYRLLKTSDFRLLRFRLLRFQNYVYSDAKKCLKTAAFRLGTQSYSQKKSPAAGSFTQIRVLRSRALTILRFRIARRARLQDTNECIDALIDPELDYPFNISIGI